MEQLALIQWELEEYKIHTQEQMERLSQQVREMESELFVKDNELKRVKVAQAAAATTISARNSIVKGVTPLSVSNRAQSFNNYIEESIRQS